MTMLTVTVDRAHPDAVYAQIADQVRRLVSSGELRPGATLPPVRQLAGDLGVNLNTVARAYRLLKEEGFLRIHDRSGVEVAAPGDGPEESLCSDLVTQMRTTLAKLRQAGMDVSEILSLVQREVLAMSPRERGNDHD